MQILLLRLFFACLSLSALFLSNGVASQECVDYTTYQETSIPSCTSYVGRSCEGASESTYCPSTASCTGDNVLFCHQEVSRLFCIHCNSGDNYIYLYKCCGYQYCDQEESGSYDGLSYTRECITASPTDATFAPSNGPTLEPSHVPSNAPTVAPTQAPVATPSVAPSVQPSTAPSMLPSDAPSNAPSRPSSAPTETPTEATQTSEAPSVEPTLRPVDTQIEATDEDETEFEGGKSSQKSGDSSFGSNLEYLIIIITVGCISCCVAFLVFLFCRHKRRKALNSDMNENNIAKGADFADIDKANDVDDLGLVRVESGENDDEERPQIVQQLSLSTQKVVSLAMMGSGDDGQLGTAGGAATTTGGDAGEGEDVMNSNSMVKTGDGTDGLGDDADDEELFTSNAIVLDKLGATQGNADEGAEAVTQAHVQTVGNDEDSDDVENVETTAATAGEV